VHGFLGLTESVHINDSDEVVKLVVSAKIDCLPDASFCNLTVSANTKNGVVDLIKIFAGVSHTTCDGKTLTQGSSCNINKWDFWNGMSLNDGVFESE
jgi:hypothetical protein